MSLDGGAGAALAVRPYARLAPLYDRVLGYRFLADLRRRFDTIVDRYGLQFDSAADVACGTGTFVAHLCQIGVPVVFGVDRSPEMLALAVKRNAATAARFLLQDLRDLRLPQRVDLITCHFDSLNYMRTPAALRGALRRFALHLRPGGHAVFDLITDRHISRAGGAAVEHVRGPRFSLTRATRCDPARRLQIAKIQIRHGDDAWMETHVQRQYAIAEVVSAAVAAGLTVRGVHDFQGLDRPPSLARRAVYVAARPQQASPGATLPTAPASAAVVGPAPPRAVRPRNW